MIRGVSRIDWQPYTVPELGLRFQRSTMVLACMAYDDEIIDVAGLPEPAWSLAMRLPAGSYAKAKLAQLATHFAAAERAPLAGTNLSRPTVETSQC